MPGEVFPDAARIHEPCPLCGARAGGRAGCQALFHELGALAWESPQRASVHNLVVDSYCMQHPEEYGRSAKSYMAHLVGLCCSVEFGSEPALYWKIARSLDGPVSVEKPPLIPFRGTRTVSDAFSVGTTEEYVERVRAWSRDVWASYQPQHDLAREWLRNLKVDTHRTETKT
ncbi:MAG: DUF5946 family protein [Gemmatimonadota bacterium]|nr:DUF5946 family protein [Gemmatimonadota bacterium]